MVPGRSGLPTLLNGLIGSMTHCNSYCAAAVAPSQVCNAIGIDAEPNRGVTPGVLDRIASSTKCEHVHYLRALHPHISFDRLLFSSKESIYKAVFSNSGDSLRFKDVRVLANPNSNFDTQITSSHLRCASLQVILGRARWNLGYYCYHSSHRSACQSDGSSRDIYLTRDKMENLGRFGQHSFRPSRVLRSSQSSHDHGG